MELDKFLYLFSKHILKTSITETICIENWEGIDFDNRYIEYITTYQRLKDRLVDKDEERVLIDFKQVKQSIFDKFYAKMKVKLLTSLRNYCNLNQEEEEKIIDDLDKSKDNSGLYKYIYKIREIETKLI